MRGMFDLDLEQVFMPTRRSRGEVIGVRLSEVEQEKIDGARAKILDPAGREMPRGQFLRVAALEKAEHSWYLPGNLSAAIAELAELKGMDPETLVAVWLENARSK